MNLQMIKIEVGPWPMNCYILTCLHTKNCVVIDPGSDGAVILDMVKDQQVVGILITHGHYDHVNALAEVKVGTNAPVYLHPDDATKFGVQYDMALLDRYEIIVGNQRIRVIHTPGHTPGQVCFDIGDHRIIVGDTIFVGGPGHTSSTADFATTMKTIREIVFKWPDETKFFPGHGPSGTIGTERAAFDAFVTSGREDSISGDVTWVQTSSG